MTSLDLAEVGARVWCVRNDDDTTVYAFGFGIYEGDFPRPGWDDPDELAVAGRALHRSDATGKAVNSVIAGANREAAAGTISRREADRRIARVTAFDAAERAKPMVDRIMSMAMRLGENPRIKLESGKTVWGCQCYWGAADESAAENYAAGRNIVIVDFQELA